MTFCCSADSFWITCCCSSSFSARSCSFSERALKRSFVQPQASRNGRATRSTPTSSGCSALATAPCASWSGPSELSRKETVISASASSTSSPSTIRRLRALVLREESERGAGRRTGRPSTADLAVRLRGTERLMVAASSEALSSGLL